MKAIIFDLDGTLWEVVDTTWKSVQEVVWKYPFLKDISKETIRFGMGKTLEECAELYMPDVKSDVRLTIMYEMLNRNVEKLKEIGGNLYEDVSEVIQRLSQNYFLAIVSNCADGYIESFLSTSHLEKYFGDFIAASKEKITKGEAIRRVIGRNGIDQAIYVGDTLKDLEASKEAHVPFVHASYGFQKDLDTKYAIDTLKELELLLDQDIWYNG